MVISSQQNKYESATPGSHPRESFTLEPDYVQDRLEGYYLP